MNRRIIGLMGNSGSGKSTVAEYLREKGAEIVDADEISHQLCELGQPGLVAIKKAFEPYYFNDDGSLNRKRLGRLVFADPNQLEKLESILHPLIKKRLEQEIKKAKSDIVIVDCALLTKVGLHNDVDEVWLVMSDVDHKISRIMQRDGISVEDAVNRLKSQEEEVSLTRYADRVIHNNGTQEEVYRQVEEYLNDTEKCK